MKTIAKNDIKVIVEEFLGRRKSAVVADEIVCAMQSETKHVHEDKVFFVHTYGNGDLVLTMESVVKGRIEVILRKYLEEGDVQECLEALTDEQMVLDESIDNEKTPPFETIQVNGADSAIYASLISYQTSNNRQYYFQEMLREAISSRAAEFEVPVCDPSVNEKGKLQFLPGFKPATCYSYNELVNLAKEKNAI